jgi:hypothetical protein
MVDHGVSGQAMVDHGQPRQTLTDPDILSAAEEAGDLSAYTMTIEEALARFTQAGLIRDKRTVARYCEHNKIDAIKVFGFNGPTWRLNPESVDGKIKNLLKFAEERQEQPTLTSPDKEPRQTLATPDTPGQTMVDHGLSGSVMANPDMSRSDIEAEGQATPTAVSREREKVLEEENTRLRQELVDEKINNRALTQTVSVLSGEIKEFGKERREMQAERRSFLAQIGDLTMRLGLLAAGRNTTPPEPIKAEIVQERVIDVSPDTPSTE